MKYNVIKIIMAFCMIIAFIIICSNTVYASELTEVLSGADDFINSGKTDDIDEKLLQETSSQIYNILLTLAIIVDFAVGIIIGIKLMTSEAENKAEAKKSLMVFVVGSVIVFGAFGIWKTMVTFLDANF